MPLAAEPTPETQGGTKEGEGAKGAFRQLVGLKGEMSQSSVHLGLVIKRRLLTSLLAHLSAVLFLNP